MKKTVPFFLALMLMFIVGCSNQNDQKTSEVSSSIESTDDEEFEMNKTLVVYYSYSGVTETVARNIQSLTEADLYAINVVDEYPKGSQETSDRAQEERESGNLPELKGTLPSLDDYDTILIGGPVWSSTVSSPILSYLEQTDLSDKKVGVFWTDAGNPGSYKVDILDEISSKNTPEWLGLSNVSSMNENELNNKLSTWLDKLLVASNESTNRDISIKVGNEEVLAELNDSEAAKEFATKIPLTLNMNRMGEHEYYGALDKPLAHQSGLQKGYEIGDLAFWTPGDLLALYFDDPENDPEGLMILGKVISNLEALKKADDSVEMTINWKE